MSKNKSIKNQVQAELMQKLAIGESHHKAKKESIDGKSEKIHSWSTYEDYVKHAVAFGKWVKPRFDIKDIKDMRPYVGMYLNFRIGDGVSPWTVALDAAALAKLYGCKSTDFGVELPKRERSTVKRSRGEVKGFKEEKYKDVVDFCKGSGVRIHELILKRLLLSKRFMNGSLKEQGSQISKLSWKKKRYTLLITIII